MLELLAAAERALPQLLVEPGWEGLHVDYHPPRVDRVWRSWGAHRIYLHRIHPCAPGDALVHPHPWPSAMRIYAGRYELGIGYGAGDTAPPIAARVIAGPGTVYEMTEPDAWHYVRPLDEPAWTLMVSGPPWVRSSPKRTHPLPVMTANELAAMLARYRTFAS